MNARRSPHGERGLKSISPISGRPPRPSLPPRGAWIEIEPRRSRLSNMQSLPPRGAWIEIFALTVNSGMMNGRSPHGERGLKYRGAAVLLDGAHVAPPTGSVD